MRVGILTYQFADNFGAVLQCFALRRVISSLPGCEAHVINYIPPDFAYQITWRNMYEKTLYRRKREGFQRFLRSCCGINTPEISDLREAESYDCYCVGSDQIWNTNKKYLAYFLPELSTGRRKISYAASLGWKPDDARLNRSVLERYVPEFAAVSVREEAHVPLVESITGKPCSCVLDPSFLLEQADYEEIMCRDRLREEPFIFFFWLPNDLTLMRGIAFVNALSRKHGLPIVHAINSAPPDLFHLDGGDMQFETPDRFLWYIKNAELVVTNSYHAINFSILFRKPFYAFVVEAMRARIDTLVHKLGIGARVIENYRALDAADMEMDYREIEGRLQKERQSSMSYLRSALEVS